MGEILVSESKSEPKTSKVAKLLLKLQEDSNFLAEFNKDPDKIMIMAGISSEQDRNTIKSRDMIKIRRLLEADIKQQKSN